MLGSCLKARTLLRLAAATGLRRHEPLVMSSLIAGATIWATHFIAMPAYDPGGEHGYEPVLTGVTLCIVALGALGTNALFAYGPKRSAFVLAGVGFGISVSVMHYVEMMVYQLPGEIIWRPGALIAFVLFGVALGIACYHRLAFPVTRYCWLGGAILMVFAICAMHFTAVSAFEIK
jgi:NO-binding membrane sensor protein with MHYT domain